VERIMHVRCTGPEKHINRIDIDALMSATIVTKGQSGPGGKIRSKRFNKKCDYCERGRVCVDRRMIDVFLESQNQGEADGESSRSV